MGPWHYIDRFEMAFREKSEASDWQLFKLGKIGLANLVHNMRRLLWLERQATAA
jgi:hypothetical protein